MVQNLLIGNGVNIQHGGYNFSNAAIILRALKCFKDPNFPVHIITNDPIDVKCYIGYLFLEIPHLLNSEYNKYANCTAERDSLKEFISKYSDRESLKITDIGFEDYYLIHDLLCHKIRMGNPEQYTVRECIKSCFLHAIYDNGNVNSLAAKFTGQFIEWILSFDNIFTTNYDVNIENATGKSVYHLHGDFITRKPVYKPDSFRNQISDRPIDNCIIDENYPHLYSTALSTHSGNYKQFSMKEGVSANSVVDKMAIAYKNNPTLRNNIDSWENNRNVLISRMRESILLKVKHPELKFDEAYPIQQIESMSGELSILGLSPYNDRHLFDMINKSSISNCIFYFYNQSERDVIKLLLSNKKVVFKDAREFWHVYGNKTLATRQEKKQSKKITFKNVSHSDFHKFADAYRGLSGSIMGDVNIIRQFNKVPFSIRVDVCKRIKELEVECSREVDQQFVLSIIDIHIIASEFDLDPAVVFCIGVDKGKNEFIKLS